MRVILGTFYFALYVVAFLLWCDYVGSCNLVDHGYAEPATGSLFISGILVGIAIWTNRRHDPQGMKLGIVAAILAMLVGYFIGQDATMWLKRTARTEVWGGTNDTVLYEALEHERQNPRRANTSRSNVVGTSRSSSSNNKEIIEQLQKEADEDPRSRNRHYRGNR